MGREKINEEVYFINLKANISKQKASMFFVGLMGQWFSF